MTQPTTREERVAAYLERLRGLGDLPALTQQIHDVMAVLEHEDRSMQHLANIVLRDYTLTLRVVRAANSFHYNRVGSPVLSVTHAMVLLGVRAVRDLAAGLLLVEYLQKRAPGLKQLMLISMLTAVQAREVAHHVDYPEPEQAYLCGMFRNLGEIVVACHAPADYARVLARVQADSCTLNEALIAVLGFRFEDLGAALAEHWHMPAPVARAVSPGQPTDQLSVITAFSHDLATVVYRHEGSPDPARLSALLARYRSLVDVDATRVRELLETAVHETAETFEHLHVRVDDLKLRHQIEVALADRPPDAAVPSRGPGAVRPASDTAQAAFSLVDEITAVVTKADPSDLSRVLLMILEAVMRVGGFDRVVFALASQDRRDVRGRFALGQEAETFADRFRLTLDPPLGPLGAAVAAGRDLVVSPAASGPRRPSPATAAFGCASCAIYPVSVDQRLVGCLYADRLQQGAQPEPGATVALARLRDLAARALARGHRVGEPVLARAAEPQPPAIAPETRHNAVLRVLQGALPATVAQELGVSADEVVRWKTTFLAGALDALTKRAE